MSRWIPTDLQAPFKQLLLPVFTREGDEGPTGYVSVSESQVADDLDLEWASDELWRRTDDADGLGEALGNGFMVPMVHWDQHVIGGELRA